MTSKYDHLKLKVFDSEFQYVLLQSGDDLTNLSEAAGDLPLAMFRGDGEFSAIIPSIVSCHDVKVVTTEPDWVCLRIIGEMPFGSVQGLIAEISGILAKKNMGICVVSTFLTDWFFIKAKNKAEALSSLQDAGWRFVES